MPPPMCGRERQPSAPHGELAPTKRRVTFQVAASDSDIESNHSEWSEASNPVERLPVYASQQSADSTVASQPSASCEFVEELRPPQTDLSHGHSINLICTCTTTSS